MGKKKKAKKGKEDEERKREQATVGTTGRTEKGETEERKKGGKKGRKERRRGLTENRKRTISQDENTQEQRENKEGIVRGQTKQKIKKIKKEINTLKNKIKNNNIT